MDRRKAFGFVILLGLVSLFGDVTYEGARSIMGPFLRHLGAGAAVVGFAAGVGEFTGYGLRIVSGLLSDRTKKYWFFVILGYCVNLLAVPLLAVAGNWEIAIFLLILERFGKALRTPARDAMLSGAAEQFGLGWGFGLHEAMDQIGAVSGPLLVAFLLATKGSYRLSLAFLAIPALLALSFLVLAKGFYPASRELAVKKLSVATHGLSSPYWLYLVAVMLVAIGFADYPLIAFHIKNQAILGESLIPVLYAYAMGVDAFSALFFGWLFDRRGFQALLGAVFLSTLFAPFAFSSGWSLIVLGMTLWGIGMGAQESIMRATVARMAPSERRSSAYGIFFAAYGLAWFAGSWAMGFLYEKNILYLVLFSVVAQLFAALILLKVKGVLQQT
ncbi:MFS transporter [Thermatribacter velox]|uniref:MFS transporter n=1 Tax=Thermatribacter velox TaxID=3039681 RepID=A0ABZ2YGH7_9BACT